MKILKIAALIVGSIIGLIIIALPFMSPKTHMERSIIVEAEPSVVFNLANNYKNFNQWSPWAAIDPDTKYQYQGPESGPGCRMSWESDNDNVGAGEQWIIETEENRYVKNGLKFGGFDGEYTSELIIEPVSEGTKLTWTYNGDVSGTGMMNVAFGKFFGMFMDSMLGPFYESGLASLKSLAEATPLPSMDNAMKMTGIDSLQSN
ncbi:MAG: SRPBCC family protein [Cyclobacteriaceae bacterium]